MSASTTTTTTPKSEMVRIAENDLCVHCWNESSSSSPQENANKGLVVIYHGFLAHGLYPTVVYAAEKLASAGYTVISADFPGHGQSGGLKFYLSDPSNVINIGVAVAQYARKRYLSISSNTTSHKNKSEEDGGMKLFLVGSSLGGCIALSVARKMMMAEESSDSEDNNNNVISGVALLAPMLRLSIDTPTRYALSALATIVPTWEIIPSSSTDGAKQYRDPDKRKVCDEDPHKNTSGKIRVGSARTCVELANNIQAEFQYVDFPILVMVADEDVVVNNAGSLELMDVAPSTDKTIKHYPALHGLLCEPSPLVDTIENDLIEWVNNRT